MEERSYKCEHCGGDMVFDVAIQSLKCEQCGTTIRIINDRSKIIEHPLDRFSTETITVKEKTSHTMECKNCGAKVEVEANCTATECPYCGTKYVLSEKQEDVIIPDGVVPFQIDKVQVGEIFRTWMKKRRLAPSALKRLYQRDKIHGVYLPYWTFDAHVRCYYTAMGGRTRIRTYKDSDGRTHTQTYTDWYMTSGHVGQFFDDIMVRASQKLDFNILRKVEPFQPLEAASYSPDYFSGYEAECCSRDLKDAHQEARITMDRTLYQLAERDVLTRFDTVRDVRIHPNYWGETYKQLILPVYTTAYDYKGRTYTVLVNGQTGVISGGYPKSGAKIALIAGAAIAAFILVYFLVWGRDARADELDTSYAQVSVMEDETDFPENWTAVTEAGSLDWEFGGLYI